MIIPPEPITKNMSKKQKVFYYSFIFLLEIIIFFSVFNEVIYEIGLVNAIDGYDYVGTYYLVSQINQTSDDVIATVNNDYQDDSSAIPLKTSLFDVVVGLRFNDLSIPINSTYISVIQWSKLSFYTTQTTWIENERCRISIYYCEDDSTFSNYTDLVNREISLAYVNWDAYNLIGNGVWKNTTDIKDVILPPIPINNNGSIVLKILSEKGLGTRIFASYDHLAGQYAPKLYVCYKLYKIKSGYQETYRGYEIFENVTILEYLLTNEGSSYTEYCIEVDDLNFNDYLIVDTNGAVGNWDNDRFIQLPDEKIYFGGYGKLYLSEDYGKTWTNKGSFLEADESVNIETTLGYYNGTLHIFYQAKKVGHAGGSYWIVIYRNLTLATWTFSDSYVIHESSLGNQYLGNIAIDKLGNLYFGFYGSQSVSSAYRAKFKEYNSTTKTFSSLYQFDLPEGQHSYVAIECEQNHTGLNAIVWVGYQHDNFVGGKVIYGRYRNENKTWSGLQVIDGSGSPMYIDSEMDIHNIIHIGWYDNGAIYYRRYNITSISYSSVINVLSATHYDPSVGCYNGSVFIFAKDNSAYKTNYKYKSYMSDTFSGEYVIDTLGYAYPDGLKFFDEFGLREGQQKHTSYYWIDDDNNTINDFDTIDDVKDDIDDYLDISGVTQYDKLAWLDDWILIWIGLAGIVMIPLSFILFGLNIQSGNIEEGFYLLMVLFIMGIGCVVIWLWG